MTDIKISPIITMASALKEDEKKNVGSNCECHKIVI